jgi:hypothetical protein
MSYDAYVDAGQFKVKFEEAQENNAKLTPGTAAEATPTASEEQPVEEETPAAEESAAAKDGPAKEEEWVVADADSDAKQAEKEAEA